MLYKCFYLLFKLKYNVFVKKIDTQNLSTSYSGVLLVRTANKCF